MSSTRTIEITVQNDTGLVLSLSSKNLKHGKWLREPEGTIGIGRSDVWKAGNREGALIGTTGTVEYKGGNDTFKIHFDHPFGSGKTVVDHSATGEYSSKLENDNLQHHHCSCTIDFYKQG
jgi:hypothetical protein